ncbi:uncharacterized protein I303_101371 [Kwoniella dejecticola CBS 10117]|uniref:J domain-containing protein n=1 Tax=Kwoniella dejecticola CBS 10117 TaxID=1296121 RepID=A0A1A6AHK4_9TREE|nr:uncharacterized protein I303_01380 [Kwoniella dejecticola CBS 10117]OBR89552.1 hypothetical protein I303_01380 [Kwoniella dejecticola CBS 10117]
MASSLPQYYSILNVSPKATADEIRQAYKRESLKTHPDRLPRNATPQERRRATERFQIVSDAYYVLSDPSRRAEYDALFNSRPSSAFTDDTSSEFEQEQASGNFFENFAQFFQNATGTGTGTGAPNAGPSEKASASSSAGAGGRTRPDAHGVFGDVFEEMLAPEVAHVRPWWSWVGGASGAAIGYIVANVPGAVAGGFAGNRLGAIRDAKGRAVGEVFRELGAGQKAEILKALAFKVLGSMS